jgi:hypothetical protein
MKPLETPSPACSIQVDMLDDKVKKTYFPDLGHPGFQERKFRREINAYQHFEHSSMDFTPRLLSYDDAACSLEIEKIKGRDLCELLEDGGDIATDDIIGQIVEIDKYLYDHQINYMNSSPKDVIYNESVNKVYIIDFEHTFLNEYFQQILYDQMFHTRMMKVKNVDSRDRFLGALRRRRGEFKMYYYRKVKNIALSASGLRRSKNTK